MDSFGLALRIRNLWDAQNGRDQCSDGHRNTRRQDAAAGYRCHYRNDHQPELVFSQCAVQMRTKILTDLYNSKDIETLLSKMEPADLRGDLKQELFVVLAEKDPLFIEELHFKKQLNFYAVRIVLNMVKSSSSRFHHMYRKHLFNDVELQEDKIQQIEEDFDLRSSFELITAIQISCIQTKLQRFCKSCKEWYLGELFRLYQSVEYNAVKVSKLTGIPARSIRTTIRDTKKLIEC